MTTLSDPSRWEMWSWPSWTLTRTSVALSGPLSWVYLRCLSWKKDNGTLCSRILQVTQLRESPKAVFCCSNIFLNVSLDLGMYCCCSKSCKNLEKVEKVVIIKGCEWRSTVLWPGTTHKGESHHLIPPTMIPPTNERVWLPNAPLVKVLKPL